MKTQIYLLKCWLIALLLTNSIRGVSQCPDLGKLTGYGAEYPARCFVLNAINGINEPIKFRLVRGACYEGQLFDETKNVSPSCGQQIGICRVQGNGCDGKNGMFDIEIIAPSRLKGKRLGLAFTNNNGLWVFRSDNGLNYKLTQQNQNGRSTYSLFLEEKIIKPFADNELQTTLSKGLWSKAPSEIKRFVFENSNNCWGNFYEACAGKELWHMQHIVRLPNKNGRAYFMLSQSRAYNGYIMLLETNPGVLDPITDEIKAIDGQAVGKIIWNDVYTGEFNGTYNPAGNWSHPGKMDVCGGLLVVAAQNWQPEPAVATACKSLSILGKGSSSVNKGTSEDAVLFYDVRDPQNPKYIAKQPISALNLTGGEISSVALLRNPIDGSIMLNVGGNGSFKTFQIKDKSRPWELGSWTPINGATLTGQHGQNFSFFDGKVYGFAYFDSNNRSNFSFDIYGQFGNNFVKNRTDNFPINLPGADRDWDADGLYVSKNGVTIVYTVKSLEGKNAEIYQVVQRP